MENQIFEEVVKTKITENIEKELAAILKNQTNFDGNITVDNFEHERELKGLSDFVYLYIIYLGTDSINTDVIDKIKTHLHMKIGRELFFEIEVLEHFQDDVYKKSELCILVGLI